MTISNKTLRIDGRGQSLLKAVQDACEADFQANHTVPNLIITTHAIHREFCRLLPHRLIGTLFFDDAQGTTSVQVKPGSCVEVSGIAALASERVPDGCIYMGKARRPHAIENPPLEEMHIQITNVGG